MHTQLRLIRHNVGNAGRENNMWTRRVIALLVIVVAIPALAEAQVSGLVRAGGKGVKKVVRVLSGMVPTLPTPSLPEQLAFTEPSIDPQQLRALFRELSPNQRERFIRGLSPDQREQFIRWLSTDEGDELQQLTGTNRETRARRPRVTRDLGGTNPVCNRGRDCKPTVVFTDDGQLTFSVECAGEKFSLKFSSPSEAPLDMLFWLSITDRTIPSWFEAYLERFPGGAFATLAQIRLAGLRAAGDVPRDVPPQEIAQEADASRIDADWQRTRAVGCGGLTFEVSTVTGTFKVTLLGIFSFGSDRQVTFSTNSGVVRFEASARAATIPPAGSAVRDFLFWHSVENRTNPREFEAYLAQFPTGMFSERAQIRLAELHASRIQDPADELIVDSTTDTPTPDPVGSATGELETAKVMEITTGGSADAILAEWVNARNGGRRPQPAGCDHERYTGAYGAS